MRNLRALSLIVAVACACLPRSHAGEGHNEVPSDLAAVTVRAADGSTFTRRLVPGEWVPCISRHDWFHSYPYEKGTSLRFERGGPRVYVSVDGGPRRLAGVLVSSPEGIVALGQAIAARVSPLVIWASWKRQQPLPVIPADIRVAVAIQGDLSGLDELAARCPGLFALRLRSYRDTPNPRALARLTRLTSLCLDLLTSPDDKVTRPTIRDLSWVHRMADLRVLHLRGGKRLDVTDLRPLCGLSKLQMLSLYGCANLSDIGPLARMAGLKKLHLYLGWHNAKVDDLAALARLTNLEELRIGGLEKLRNISPLGKLIRLRTLHLTTLPQLSDIQPLAELSGLEEVSIQSCQRLADLTPLAALSNLRRLSIGRCHSVSDLRPVGSVKSLESLHLSGGQRITDLGPLAGLTNLTKLTLWDLDNLEDLTPVGALPKLRSLFIGCDQATDITPLANVASLECLTIYMPRVDSLSPLARLTGLLKLRFVACQSVRDIRPIAKMTGLTSIEFWRCKNLTDLRPLARLTRLRSLSFYSCTNLSDLSPLGSLRNLKKINLWSCQKVKDLSPLRAMIKRGGEIRIKDEFQKQIARLRAKTDF